MRQAASLGRNRIAFACVFALLAFSGIGASSAQAGQGWAFKEKLGSAEEPAFNRASKMAVDGNGDINVIDSGGNETQWLFVKATAGQFNLTFEGETTADLTYNASATTVRDALRALPAIGSTGVSSVFFSSSLSRYTISFGGTLAATNVEQLTCADGAAPLSGGSGCSVETPKDGSHWGLKRFHPDGTAANFSALGTNVIDGAGGGECPTVPADCDKTPSGSTANSIFDAVAIDRSGGVTDGNIYVAHSGKVDIFSGAGEYLGQLTESTAAGAFASNGLRAIAVDEAGNVYVPDNGFGSHGDWIHKYEPSANPPTNADNVASFPLTFDPQALVAGSGPSDGYFFASSSETTSIHKLDSETGVEDYEFGKGAPRAVDPVTGTIVVAAGHDAVEWDASGAEAPEEPVAEAEEAGTEQNLNGLALADGADTLYLTDFSVSRVSVFEKVPVPAVVGIDAPVAVSGAKAIVSGTVNPEGVEVSECVFEYGKTTAYGLTVPCNESLPEDSSDHEVTADLSGMLANGITYHYRLAIEGGLGGHDKSEDKSFITSETFTTDAATDVTRTEATVRGTVRPEGLELTGCRIEWGETSDYGHSAPCDPHFSSIPNDDADHGVKAAIDGLEPSTIYHFRLVAENELGQLVGVDRTFATEGMPAILSQSPIEVEQTTATLQARVNPFGIATAYHFEWGPSGSFPNRIPANHELFAGSGFEPVVVTADLTGLQPASHYQFRVVATNADGTVVGETQRLETMNANGLPDNRAFELVTPADKGPAGNVVSGFLIGQVSARPAANGDSYLWPLQNGMPGTTAGGWLMMKANRTVLDGTPRGWSSAQVSSPSLVQPPEQDQIGFTPPSKVNYASPDLRCGVLETYNPLTPDTPQLSVELGVVNLYLWREGGDGQVSYQLITSRLPLNPEASPAAGLSPYGTVRAAEDCSRVYFLPTSYQLLGGEVSRLYEWEAASGELRDAGLRPDGSVGADMGFSRGHATIGSPNGSNENAVTPDGRLFFTALNSANKPAVFMRSGGGTDAGGQVVEISTSETATPDNGARFEAASADGSTVFFRANHGLDAGGIDDEPTSEQCGPLPGETANEGSSPKLEAKACDLYAYDVASEELSDLTVDPNPADPFGAAIQGTVAVDQDGSRVYFATLGQLVPGKGRTYAQNTADRAAGGGSVNVYLHDSEAAAGEELTYVTNLEWAEDARQFSLTRFNSSAQASADGARLLYEATSRQNWYDGGGGAVAYLYDADADTIRCVSCRPDGEPTAVTPDGLLQPNATVRTPLLTQLQRSLSENGSRAFFTSPDVLAPGAEQGKENVYEWEEGQLSLLAVAARVGSIHAILPELFGYKGSSADGSSAFLATARNLVPQDRDTIADVYAVREGGGVPFSEPPPDCQVDEAVPLEPNQIYCQGDKTPEPRASSPASAGFAGAGNPMQAEDSGVRCIRIAHRAQRLARKAKALRRRAKHASSKRARHRLTIRAHRFAKAARSGSRAAKRCRLRGAGKQAKSDSSASRAKRRHLRHARAANTNRGGAK